MINIKIQTQPDDESCGPTSLHAVYNFYNYHLPLADVVNTIERSPSGGTLSTMLGKHALMHGFDTTLYVYNLNLFDPTWFHHGEAENDFLINKLQQQLDHKKEDCYLLIESQALLDYLALGGKISFHPLRAELIKDIFKENIPIITGLSATYLYKSAREYYTSEGKSIYDDIRGTPCGHFVILCGYDEHHRHVVVADPHKENPFSHDNYYKVSINRLINAIMLGVLTYDANLLVIKRRESNAINFSH